MATRFTPSLAKRLTSIAFALISGCGGSTDEVRGPITLELLAGSPTADTSGSVDGTGVSARFLFPTGVVADSSGTVYVADAGNNTIRRIAPDAAVTTFAGTASASGSIDANGAAARFNNPFGIARDRNGNLFVADSANHTIRKITPGGAVITFAGTAGVFGAADGVGSMARFYLPTGVAVDSEGNVFVADFNNRTVRKIDASASCHNVRRRTWEQYRKC